MLGATAEELKRLAWPCMYRLSQRDVTERDLRVAGYVVACSLAIGRHETGAMNQAEVALACRMSKGNVSTVLDRLRRMRVIQDSKDGLGYQFLPESDHEKGHHWDVCDRLRPSSRLMANRLERAHRRRAGEMDLPGMEEPDLKAALGEVAVEAAAEAAGQRSGVRGQGSEGLSDLCRMGEGGDGTGGGGEKFLSRGVPESGTSHFPAPLKAFPPSPSSTMLFNTPTLKRGLVPESGTFSPQGRSGGSEARMDGEDYLDPNALDETTLIKRLRKVVGDEGRDGMKAKGGRWRLRIRGTQDAADDPTTAQGMRYALNLLDRKRVEGGTIASPGGFVYEHWMDYCTTHGWRLVWNAQHEATWERCKPYSFFAWKQAEKRGKKQAVSAVT